MTPRISLAIHRDTAAHAVEQDLGKEFLAFGFGGDFA